MIASVESDSGMAHLTVKTVADVLANLPPGELVHNAQSDILQMYRQKSRQALHVELDL